MYERFFSLKDQPFRLTPDPKYLYLGKKHREGYAHLLFAMREGSGFVAVTGEVGTGKTTLVRALLKETQDEDVAVAYIFNPVLSPTELLQTINAEFGLPSRSTSKKELTETLNSFLLEQKADGGRAVVIVDEAQNLEPAVLEQLRLLSNLETETDKLLQIILLGQPELRDVLDRPDLRQLSQRVALRWHLDPLDRSEVHKYVRHRMRIAGGDEFLFEPKSLDLLFDYSGGLPRLINILAHRSLLVAFTQGAKVVGPSEVHSAASELGEGRVPLRARSTGWVYKAAAGIAVTAAAAAVAFLLVSPLRDDGPRAASSRSDRINNTTNRGAQGADKQRNAEVAALTESAHGGASRSNSTQRGHAKPNGAKQDDLVGDEEFDQKLIAMDRYDSAAGSISRLIDLWTGEGLSDAEIAAGSIDIEKLAEARGLSYYGAVLTPDHLRVIDLPAVVELEAAGGEEKRFALLRNMDDTTAAVRVDSLLDIDVYTFEGRWTGVTHVLWKDHDSLRRKLTEGASGPPVMRLQLALRELGVFTKEPKGVYGPDTVAAMKTFQTSYGLAADGIADTLTQIVLYNALARQERPSLSKRSPSTGRKAS